MLSHVGARRAAERGEFDFATVIGIPAGLVLITIGIYWGGGTIWMYADPSSVFITVGGSACAMLVNFPWRDLLDVRRTVKHAFFVRPLSALRVIQDFRRYADIARRDGILALENVTSEIQDPFLVRGVQLAVDGTDPEVIQTMMRTELEQMCERHDKGVKFFKQWAQYAPAFGMIGTLIGLVIMLANLEDIHNLGKGMAVAIITTFYGAIMAYLVFIPIADKLESRSKEEVMIREMMIKGVMSIQSGDNPRIVEQKLRIFLPPRMRNL